LLPPALFRPAAQLGNIREQYFLLSHELISFLAGRELTPPQGVLDAQQLIFS
jgi:hypothetical protein